MLNFKKIFSITLFFSYFTVALPAREVNGHRDFMFWFHQDIEKPINKKYTFTFEAEERWGGNASVLFLTYLQSNLIIKVRDWFDFAPGYRQTFFRLLPSSRWSRIYDPMFYALFHKKWGEWEFTLRHQVQYRIFEEGPELWLYRIRPLVYLPIELGKKIKAKPYLFDEFFFLEDTGFMENRVGGGLRFTLHKHLSSQLQYFLRSLKVDNGWIHQNVIRLYAIVHF